MGRFIGWIGPIAYLAAVGVLSTLAIWFACFPGNGYLAAWLSLAFGGHASMALDATTPLTADGIDALSGACIVLAATWCVAVLWFIGQAAVRHDGLDDERWTAHMLAVGLVGRVVLAPLCVACTLGSAVAVGAAIEAWGYHGSFWTGALWTEAFGMLAVLPVALYQICGAARLAHRGLLGTTGLVWNVILAFLPTLGFVAMCGLYVNGREELIAAHDRRVVADAMVRCSESQTAQEDGDADQTAEPEAETVPDPDPAPALPAPDPRPDARV